MKYLFESTDDQKRIPITKLTWDKIAPVIDPDAPKWKWQKDTVDLPYNSMSTLQISSETQFEQWFGRFVKRWGTDGELVETRPTYWRFVGNKKWDESSEKDSASISKYYDEKGSGGYTGD